MKKVFIALFTLLLALPLSARGSGDMAGRLAGRILLQVQGNGEAWYIEPGAGMRAYLGRPADAFRIMREQGQGITNADLGRIPIGLSAPTGPDTDGDGLSDLLEDAVGTDKAKADTDSDGYSDADELKNGYDPRSGAVYQTDAAFSTLQSGKIFLQVEKHGEAWYVNPGDHKRYFLGRPADAFQVMREQGLGVTNADLEKVPVDENYYVTETIKRKVADFINKNLTQPGSEATIVNITPEGDMYRVEIRLSSGQEITSYTDKAVTKFFPQALDMDQPPVQPAAPAAPVTPENLTKTDKPTVELFVMSYCPYGVQMEKAILPVVATLGSAIDFEIKFVDYAMHGKKEVDENLRQYCLEKNNQTEYLSYLECFLADGDSGRCLTATGIATSTLDACMAATDEEYGINAAYEDKSTWRGNYPSFATNAVDAKKYSVSGSPTLVINGSKLTINRSPQSLLEAICGAFTAEPAECLTTLPLEPASAGFGYNGTAAAGTADCGP